MRPGVVKLAAGDAMPAPSSPCLAYVVRTDRVREVKPGQAAFSPLASLRLRVLIPAAELARRWAVRLVPFEQFLEDPALRALGTPQAVVIGKLSVAEVETMAWRRERLFESIRACPCPVFADFSDNYAALGAARSAALVEYQDRMAALVPLTVPCAALAEQLRAQAAHGVHVIEDPYELEEAPAEFSPPADELRLCWFGASYDADLVQGAFVALAQGLRATRLRLDLVAAPTSRAFAAQMSARLAAVHPQAAARFVEWSPAASAAALAAADLVVLPQDTSSPWGRAKSHNRLVQAIRAGRVALASPIPSYLELAAFACVGEDLASLAQHALARRTEVLERVRAGQAHVRERFAPQRIAQRWAEVLRLG